MILWATWGHVMPSFPTRPLPEFRHARPLSAYISGQAQKMAFEQNKVQTQIYKEQATELAYKNSPKGRAEQAEVRLADLEYKRAQTANLNKPLDNKITLSRGVTQGDQEVTYLKVGGSIYLDENGEPIEVATGSKRTGTVADPSIQKSTAGAIEKDIVSLRTAVGQLERISGDDIDELFTVQGRALTSLASMAAWFGVANEDQIRRVFKDQNLRSTIELSFQRIRKEVTGAQAAMVELSYLQEAIFSAKMNPKRLKAAVQSYVDGAKVTMQILRSMKSELYENNTEEGKLEFGAEFDRRWARARKHVDIDPDSVITID